MPRVDASSLVDASNFGSQMDHLEQLEEQNDARSLRRNAPPYATYTGQAINNYIPGLTSANKAVTAWTKTCYHISSM